MPFCLCSALPGLVFACSGSSDVGELADRAARRLAERGTVQMACLAGIGGRVSGIVASVQAADKLLVIDGCAQECGKHCLEEAGFSGFLHLCLRDLGLEKGASPVNEGHIRKVAEAARRLLLQLAQVGEKPELPYGK